jgi:hypothetical protein
MTAYANLLAERVGALVPGFRDLVDAVDDALSEYDALMAETSGTYLPLDARDAFERLRETFEAVTS